MNIFRPQIPYVFRPPKYSTWFKPILFLVSSRFLKKKFKIAEIKISGAEELTELVRRRESILVAPNHADHADPSLMVTAARRSGFIFHFMAAREGFEKDAFTRFFLQKAGAFSVNREGGDIGAIKTAIQLLQEGNFPLVIFPEGEIYHHHEVLDELNDGVASIVLRASSKLPEGKTSYVVPAGIRIRHSSDISNTFSERLDRLEKHITWKPRLGLDPVDRIYRLGSALLTIKEEEFLGYAQTGEIIARTRSLQDKLMEPIELAHGESNSDMKMTMRIKALRGKIRKELTDESSPVSPEREKELYDELDRIFLANQLYSYPGRYLKENPTDDRIAETLFKLEEDVLEIEEYYGPRTAELVFGKPIAINTFLEEGGFNFKSGVTPLTETIREKVQGLLQSMNT
ncbi:MAG: lysophospholipid acyltransferase family protein [Verrucomicrobia bacterium]|nr:lysophospholipid acyltransferase family protein [Verrucomicrobiota bacterium]MDA1065337.1 lysophospholipid acyltransferase family protein [Verrucomicrobiota bacterium]